ncbi:hypothetical protein GALMADRAFT_63484 [Galerina marginata CBS 339.88]|uniref:Ketoreductase (KR) domain-containing protein n=1 Tax=Galerina marginata (strain CBS 339.88) TaxID=685588 RepID=A0A067TAY3_GALM3|nr:hypothetical protein GALMADRAFT_63484 [Galerina marginata CBS 339.88]
MSSLSAIRAANAAFRHSSAQPPVAVFVGGTSGIGEGMALTFAEHTKGNSNIVIVGRNRAAAEKIFASMPAPRSGSDKAAREFVQCDVSLMKNIQTATKDILARYPKINYLVMSPGMLTLSGRDETSEGIDKKLALHYYARWKFAHDLLPAVQKAKDEGEEGVVMSVLSAGQGGAANLDDLALKKTYSLANAALAASTYTDLMMEAAPNVTFIHGYPGFVRTPLMTTSNTALIRGLSSVLLPLVRPFSISGEESSQYMWNAVYNTATKPGVWRTGARGEDLGKKGYSSNESIRDKVWEHTVQVMKDAMAVPESQ